MLGHSSAYFSSIPRVSFRQALPSKPQASPTVVGLSPQTDSMVVSCSSGVPSLPFEGFFSLFWVPFPPAVALSPLLSVSPLLAPSDEPVLLDDLSPQPATRTTSSRASASSAAIL